MLRVGDVLVIYVPASNNALVFRIKEVYNFYRDLPYGPLPLSSGDTLTSYDGGTVSVPADGVLPARAYTSNDISFPLNGAYDENDMWYLPASYRERLFHVIQRVSPEFIRIDVRIPKGVTQARFQRDNVILGIDKGFGFTRGVVETIHVPELRYGFRYGNDTNLPVYTSVKFTYAEYVVEPPTSAQEVVAVITKKLGYWWVMPVTSYVDSIRNALVKTYGIEGFPVLPPEVAETKLSTYSRLLSKMKEVMRGG